MKRTLFIVALLLVCTSAARAQVNSVRFFYCIIQVEHNLGIGRDGEIGPLAILPETAKMLGFKKPLADMNVDEYNAVAAALLKLIAEQCAVHGVPFNEYTAALRWNAGPYATHFNHRNWSYARRAQALYRSIKINSLAPK